MWLVSRSIGRLLAAAELALWFSPMSLSLTKGERTQQRCSACECSSDGGKEKKVTTKGKDKRNSFTGTETSRCRYLEGTSGEVIQLRGLLQGRKIRWLAGSKVIEGPWRDRKERGVSGGGAQSLLIGQTGRQTYEVIL